MQKYYKLLIAIFSLFILTVLLTVILYAKFLPAVVSSEAFIDFIQKSVKSSVGADFIIEKPILQSDCFPKLNFSADNIELKKNGQNLFVAKKVVLNLYLIKILKKNIILKEVGADYIYADVDKLMTLSLKEEKNKNKKFGWKIRWMRSLLYLKNCEIKYSPNKDVNALLIAKNIVITEKRNPKYAHFDILAKIKHNNETLSLQFKDNNAVYIKDNVLHVDNGKIKLNDSILLVNAYLDENNGNKLNFSSENFSLKDIYGLVNSNLVIPNGSEILKEFSNLEGAFSFNTEIIDNKINGELNLKNAIFKLVSLKNLPIHLTKGNIKIDPNNIKLSNFEGYYGSNSNNKITSNGEIKDYTKSPKIDIMTICNAKNELFEQYISKLTNAKITLIGNSKTVFRILTNGDKINLLAMFKLAKGNDILLEDTSFSSTNYDRVLMADMNLDGQIFNIKSIDYYVASVIDRNSTNIKPILTLNGNLDLAENGKFLNLGFVIPKPLPSEFLNVLIGQKLFKKGTISGKLEILNTDKMRLFGKIELNKVLIQNLKELSLKYVTAHAHKIIFDKTGTLTQNKMQVVQVVTPNMNNSNVSNTIELATMCTDVEITYDEGTASVTGDPTEVAIVNECYRLGKTKKSLYNQYERIGDIPFDSSRKLMTTIHKIGDRYRIITKGAPDVLIKRCSKYYANNQVASLNMAIIKTIEQQNESMAKNALRVIAVGYKDVESLPIKIESNYVENDLIFTGLIGMIDPPREGVKEAISTCRKAGIKTVMITGDHITTANAIATELGILRADDLSITGSELDRIPKEQFKKDIMKYSVFARVTPEHKVEIVKAFQGTGAVVAMTGDGVNDAPALKNADIGIAMGLNGTDVAKNAADMVLTDDNFVTIVEAVKYGRTIFSNIRKAIHFLIATNVGEIVSIFLGLLVGMRSPMLAIQLLWINLITDSLPAIALGLENPEENVMLEKPRNPKKSIFSDGLWGRIIVEGSMIGILNLLAFTIGKSLYGLEVGRTMAFISLGLSELIHSFNIRTEESIFKTGIFQNKYLLLAFLGGGFLQVIVVIVPQLAEIFKLTNLNATQWMYTIGISMMPIIIMEAQKFTNGLKFGKVVNSENKNVTAGSYSKS
mgnify:CR=1 FL=1